MLTIILIIILIGEVVFWAAALLRLYLKVIHDIMRRT